MMRRTRLFSLLAILTLLISTAIGASIAAGDAPEDFTAPGGCDPADIAADGVAVEGNWGGDCESAVRTGRQARYYQFTLTDSDDITVLLESEDAETVLYLREGAGTTSGATTPDGFNEGDPNDYHRASVEESLAVGTYTIEATTYAAGETGSFTLTVSSAVPGGCGIADVATDGSAVSGTWASDCQSEVTADRNARYYTFTLEADAGVTITLRADAAEPVLHLREGKSKTGTEIDKHEGFQAEGYKRAEIAAENLAAGTYTIEARTYTAGYEGGFTLTVAVAGGAGSPAPGACDIAEIATDGRAVSGTWGSDCQSEETADRNARYYTFTLAAAAGVTITLDSDAGAQEPVLHLREGKSKTGTELDSHEGFAPDYTQAQIVAEELAAGTYTIEARTYSAGYEGPFTLTVSVVGGATTPSPGGCGIADVATDGSAVSGEWDNDCQSEITADRNARYYTFTLAEASDVTITLRADADEPVLHLREGESKTGTELDKHEGFQAEGYKRAEIAVENLAAGTYTIEARTYSAGYEGAFTLTVSVKGGSTTPPAGNCGIADVTTDGSPVSGSWAPDCQSEITADRNARYYTFNLGADAGVTITLRADAAEPVLHLREGKSKTGTQIGKHEGFSPDYTRAQIVVEELAAGTYTIEARTYSAGYEGAFTLTVAVAGGTTPPPAGDCGIADVTTDGTPVEGSWGADCESTDREGSYARYYQFTLADDSDVTAVLESGDAGTALYLREGAGNTSGDNVGFNEGGQEHDYRRASVEAALDAGTYTVEATTKNAGETGSFTLTIQAEAGSAPAPPPPAPLSDRAALIQFYHATGGPNWRYNFGWLSSDPIKHWWGVFTDSSGRVAMLRLPGNNLRGVIPASLGSLTKMHTLVLNNNQLRGSIPKEFGNLRNLDGVDLDTNQLTGSIPKELGKLSKLRVLDLSINQLSGNIPKELGNLAKLEGLGLHRNQLTGSIPADLGKLTSLTKLYLSDNDLSGSIPADLGKLTSLTDLALTKNQLTGSIPADLGKLTKLTYLVLFNNQLTGAIPADLGKLTGLTDLGLSTNQLTGSIPADLGKLAKLTYLNLNSNQLSGSIPADLGKLTKLTDMGLASNQLTGSIPADLGKLTKMINLNLSSNDLSGEIPSQLGSLNDLDYFHLSGRGTFTGCIPAGLSDVPDNDFDETGLSFCTP